MAVITKHGRRRGEAGISGLILRVVPSGGGAGELIELLLLLLLLMLLLLLLLLLPAFV